MPQKISNETSNQQPIDVESDSISKIAKGHFANKVKWDPKVIDTIVKTELEPSDFSSRKLSILEHYRYLEKYLWPHYNQDASLNHILSICLLVNEKARQNVPLWDAFADDTEKFSLFFKRITQLVIDVNVPLFICRQLLIFLIQSFQSLDTAFVRTECLKLTTIGVWTHLAHDGRREQLFSDYPNLLKLWNTSNKKLNAAKGEAKEQLEFGRNWLSSLMKRYIDLIYEIPEDEEVDEEVVKVCERLLEFFIDLEGQLSTRRFFNTLLDDHQIIVLSQMAPFMQREENDIDLLKELLSTLSFYSKFEINDHTGVPLTDIEMTETHCQQLLQLQHIAFRYFRNEIKELPLANLSSIDTRQDLLWHLEPLSEQVLTNLCNMLNIRTAPLHTSIDLKSFLINILIDRYQRRESQIEIINKQPLYPDEEALFSNPLIQSHFNRGDHPLALPKLNLQFLTFHDYLLRNFSLFKLKSFYEVRQDLEETIKELQPRLTYPDYETEFAGAARMALSLNSFGVVEVGEANLGEDKPSRVRADVTYDIGQCSQSIRKEWDALRKHDVLFLVTIEALEKTSEPLKEDEDFKEHYGIKHIRGCEIVDVIGSDGRPIDEFSMITAEDRAAKLIGTQRTLRVELDPNQYKMDMDKVNNKQAADIHPTFNILVRRRPQENNFKSVLETIRDLMQTHLVMPDWLQKVFLGYGDPAGAHYRNIPTRERVINLRDTFLDWDHFKSSFASDRNIQVAEGEREPLDPPYVVTLLDDPMDEDSKPAKKSKKTKKTATAASETFEVSTFKTPNMGPYKDVMTKKNQNRFTAPQAEAIYSGMNNGLTMVVGPKETTDVAVQIIANLYRNHPEQHTLVVTHSNHALNQIVEKILELDVDARHILRLGHGEKELNTEIRFSRYGRVTAALENRLVLLQEVSRLAQALAVPGEHGATCETANYFFSVHVQPRWEEFKTAVKEEKAVQTVEGVRELFPFADYFVNTPTPVFTDAMTVEEALESATGCFRHLQDIFQQLEEIRPFELLKTGHERADYLLTKEAKIVAMTSTYAALKRRELVEMNFRYDTIVFEEAAQVLEVEMFIPLLLQKPHEGENRLKRAVILGDRRQLPRTHAGSSFQEYANVKQSMFARFIRLGIPTVQLEEEK
ncbi:MAG: AAA domain-containing protein [Benjaminiella poitrasii]|nr:MAG: AAA domain-containing protein [Benjaminiella poitrasii]